MSHLKLDWEISGEGIISRLQSELLIMILVEDAEEAVAEWTDVLIFNRESYVIVNYCSLFQKMGQLKDMQLKMVTELKLKRHDGSDIVSTDT